MTGVFRTVDRDRPYESRHINVCTNLVVEARTSHVPGPLGLYQGESTSTGSTPLPTRLVTNMTYYYPYYRPRYLVSPRDLTSQTPPPRAPPFRSSRRTSCTPV